MSCQQNEMKTKIYHDKARSKKYREDDELIISSEGHKHLWKILRDLSGSFGHNISALDLGCGTGRYFHCLENVETLTGVDVSQHMLKEARNPVRREKIRCERINLVCANVFELGLNPQSFHFIYSIGLFIGYSLFSRSVCNTLFNLLNPGGKFFFTVADVALGVTYSGLRDVMDSTQFMHYEISRYGSSSTSRKYVFYECVAIKGKDISSAGATSGWPAVSPDNSRSLDVVWSNVELITKELVVLIPPRDTFILVDYELFRDELAIGRRVLPFLERDGQYWGPPPDDITAIQELERLHRLGASFIVFAWPAFWMLDNYSELNRHLRSQFRCVIENELMIVFDLRP